MPRKPWSDDEAPRGLAGHASWWSVAPFHGVVFGGMLAGWGIFNFVEGLIDHQILGIHHVRPGHPHQLLYDLLFLASGIVLMLVGWRMWKAAPRAVA